MARSESMGLEAPDSAPSRAIHNPTSSGQTFENFFANLSNCVSSVDVVLLRKRAMRRVVERACEGDVGDLSLHSELESEVRAKTKYRD